MNTSGLLLYQAITTTTLDVRANVTFKNYKRHSITNSTTFRVPIFLWINTKTEGQRYEHANFMKHIYVYSHYRVGLSDMRLTVS